jgi:hypothetical protein
LTERLFQQRHQDFSLVSDKTIMADGRAATAISD